MSEFKVRDDIAVHDTLICLKEKRASYVLEFQVQTFTLFYGVSGMHKDGSFGSTEHVAFWRQSQDSWPCPTIIGVSKSFDLDELDLYGTVSWMLTHIHRSSPGLLKTVCICIQRWVPDFWKDLRIS